MDRFHVESVAEDELDPLLSAQIGEPIPGKDALDGDNEVSSEGLYGGQEIFRSAPHVLVEQDLPLTIENAEVHGLGVQIDPAVVAMWVGVESHGSLLERLVFASNQPTSSEVGRGGGLEEDQSAAADSA
jgi:hypothetical protein